MTCKNLFLVFKNKRGTSVRDSCEGNEGGVAMCAVGGACAGSGGVIQRDCCRLLGVIRELWEDLPYSSPFFFVFNKGATLVGLKIKM